MAFTSTEYSGNLTVDQLEMARIDRELVAVGKRHEGLLSAIRSLTQRERALVMDLDLALQFNGKTVRPAATIAIELGEVRLGIVELERLRRDSERQKAELESLGTNLSFALSFSQSRPAQNPARSRATAATTTSDLSTAGHAME